MYFQISLCMPVESELTSLALKVTNNKPRNLSRLICTRRQTGSDHDPEMADTVSNASIVGTHD